RGPVGRAARSGPAGRIGGVGPSAVAVTSSRGRGRGHDAVYAEGTSPHCETRSFPSSAILGKGPGVISCETQCSAWSADRPRASFSGKAPDGTWWQLRYPWAHLVARPIIQPRYSKDDQACLVERLLEEVAVVVEWEVVVLGIAGGPMAP